MTMIWSRSRIPHGSGRVWVTGERWSSSKGPEWDGSTARDQDSETSLRTVVPFCGKKPSCIVKVILIHVTVIQ